MDLTKYRNHVNKLKQCITNVELAKAAYRTAEENCSYGMHGAQEKAAEAKKQLEKCQDTLECQFRISMLDIQEVPNER